ncbi:MAG: malonic semialdehyde reductase [Candidatus Methanofastidiosum methylothiophilum]|uniref:Malonic semialdehyde reductase n=1 Tax=Candidatus Methanofastidiosum methylothiophilum TaxID=1705564 RepID=A0A150IIH4_9EURY|nr:MAG: malonic semialdehyde reductase [Candidatus Methanofastidiosum methylthiophilus]
MKNQNNSIIQKSKELLLFMKKRRTIRLFDKKEIPLEVIENCISIAGTAPSGANMQPWTFVVVKDQKTKEKIRIEAEKVEEEFYSHKISDEWRECLKPLNLDIRKPFLEQAPYLICIFYQIYSLDKDEKRVKHYYPIESIGIATGFLISALHQLGIATLTYTPAPMNFLNKILSRPESEKPFLILVVGYPSSEYNLPTLSKKELKDIMVTI